MTWDSAAIELACRLWREGLSASHIAARIGEGVTRCAVLGRLHRLGLCRTSRPQAPEQAAEDAEAIAASRRLRAEGYSYETIAKHVSRSREWVRWRVRPKVLRPKAAPSLAKLPSVEPVPDAPKPILSITSRRLSIMQLTSTTCRYPLGDPHDSDFSYCGNSCVPGLSYCDGHHRLCYRPYVPKAAPSSASGMHHPAGASRILDEAAA
jgi:GcrA cell cycle regulator